MNDNTNELAAEHMGDLFSLDWSFVLVLVMLAIMTIALLVRRARMKRRARREERRARRRAYKAWLRNSRSQALEAPDSNKSAR